MALFSDSTVLMANKAFGKIKALASQARSYSAHPRMVAARGTAGRLANSSWTSAKGLGSAGMGNSLYMRAGVGAGVGAAGGVGYDAYSNNRSDWRSKLGGGIKGALLGGAAGGASAFIKPLRAEIPGLKRGIGSSYNQMRTAGRGMYDDMSSRWAARVAEAASPNGTAFDAREAAMRGM